jgi:dTDP-4-dehydrorhamnose 3,5-epimerase
MPFTFSATSLPGVLVIEPRVFADDRGFFMETYKQSEFADAGIAVDFVQANHSRSVRGTLRGLHFQRPPRAQAKLVRVIAGEVFDVAVDVRRGSPTFGQSVCATLSAENRRSLFVPAEYAHGFCVLSAEAEVLYSASAEYAPALESGVLWNDPALAIPWPVTAPLLAERDRRWPPL